MPAPSSCSSKSATVAVPQHLGQEGEFQADLTLGLIALLPKKNDQCLLTNKRPITLLNTTYKIAAKAMQRRLRLLLERLISPQQHACLPGRNIHHSLLMLGEMLFIWTGRARVARATVNLPKEDGGLGIIGVTAQYDSLTNGLMIWIMAEGVHPLRTILRSHIMEASERRWGTKDLSWLVSKCRTIQMQISAQWKNLWKGWSGLKKLLRPRRPANLEEGGGFPLWRPHLNHHNERLVKCNTRARRELRESGFKFTSDVFSNEHVFISWEMARGRGAPPGCEGTFRDLISNLKHDRK